MVRSADQAQAVAALRAMDPDPYAGSRKEKVLSRHRNTMRVLTTCFSLSLMLFWQHFLMIDVIRGNKILTREFAFWAAGAIETVAESDTCLSSISSFLTRFTSEALVSSTEIVF